MAENDRGMTEASQQPVETVQTVAEQRLQAFLVQLMPLDVREVEPATVIRLEQP